MKYTEKRIDGVTYKMQEFMSIGELTNYLKETPTNEHFKGSSLSSHRRNDYRFFGTNDYQEAHQLLHTGWKAYAEKITKRIPVQTTQAPAQRTKQIYSVVGGQASVPRYLQGIPTNMIDRQRFPSKQKVIVINRDISYAAMVSTHKIEEEGIKALQLIQGLENKGFRVKLNLYWMSKEGNECVAFKVTVKKPEERLSLIKVAFPIAHPSMLRRIGFRWIEVMPTLTNFRFTYGYGVPSGREMKKLVPSTEFMIPNFIENVDEFINKLGL